MLSNPSHRSLRSSLLLAVPAAVLASTFAVPAQAAEPGGDPRGGERGNSSQARDNGAENGHGRKAQGPKAENPRATDARAKGPQGPKDASGSTSQSPDGTPGAPAPAEPQADEVQPEQRRVVVCKYVRKPGETEIPHHVIVVDYHALEGRGFAGSFPYPFSDGQVGSVAVRYAEDGEQASEISLAGCPAATEVPAGEELPRDETPDDELVVGTPGEGGEVLGVVAEAPADEAPARAEDAAAAGVEDEDGGVLPDTGSPAYLTMMALLGALLTAAGAALLIARRRRSVV